MSNIFITDIVGQNDFAVPATDAALATATTELDTLLQTVANLDYVRALAWVETKEGASAPRTLNCLVERFEYSSEECPDATETQTMTAAIESTLEADADITSIGGQQVHVYKRGEYYLWERETSSGFLYAGVATDDIAVGGAAPNGMWFNDGDLVLGASAMSGTETLRVVGDERLEGGLLITESAAVPLAPAAGEGTFWVRNDAPNVPMYTDDAGTDHVLAYASTLMSLFGIDQVIFVDKASGGSYTPDGTIQKPYNSVQSAVTAAVTAGASGSNKFGIIISSGVYDETVTIANEGLYLIGADRNTTIIQQSSGSSTVLLWNAGNCGLANLTIRTVGEATGYAVHSNAPSTTYSDWLNCDFTAEANGDDVFYLYRPVSLRAHGCRFIHGDDSLKAVDATTSGGCNAEFHNCHFEGQFYTTTGDHRFHGCFFTSSNEGGGTIYIRADLLLTGCYIENTSVAANAYAIYLRGGTSEALGCEIRGGANVTSDTFSTNYYTFYVNGCSLRHGLHGYVRQPGKGVRYAAGGDGDRDYYNTVRAAYDSLSGADGYVIYMLGDSTESVEVNGGVAKSPVVFDGLGRHLTGSGTQVFLSSTQSCTVRNMEVTGQVRWNVGDWVLRLENVNLNGRLWWDGGSSASALYAHDTRIEGTSTYPSPITFQWDCNLGGQLLFDHCYLKGYTGNAAVVFNNSGGGADYDNLYFAYTKLFHGDLSTNNPFSGYDDPISYHAHHCVMNQEPALADPTNLTNEIDSGQRFNTIDPDGDYYWIP